MMNDDMNDDRISKIYRSGDQPSPPPSLDAAILQAARKAAEPVPPSRRAPFSPFGSRLAPLSVAAVVLVTVLLVPALLKEEQTPRQLTDAARPVPAGFEPGAVPESLMLEGELGASRRDIAPAPAPAAATAPPARQAAPVEAMQHQGAGDTADEKAIRLKSYSSIVQDRMPQRGSGSRPPAEWLHDIRRLEAEGRTQQARLELERFIRAYPDYAVEPALTEALGLTLPPTGQAQDGED